MQKLELADDTLHLLTCVVNAMQEKKGENIISLDLNNIQDSVSGYFIICHGASTTQVNAIYDNILKQVFKNCDTLPFHKEGHENSEWILIDYFDIVVHIFRKDIREFYKLEDLWADAVTTNYKDA